MIIKKSFFLIYFLLLISLVSCKGSNEVILSNFNSDETLKRDDLTLTGLFPANPGRTWIYQCRETNYSYYYNYILSDVTTREIWKIEKDNRENNKVILMKRKKDDITGYQSESELLFLTDSSELLWNRLKEEKGDYIFNAKLLTFPLQESTSWETTIPFDGYGFYVEIPGTNKISTLSETVNIPAGTFSNCIRTDFSAQKQLQVRGAGLSDVNGTITYWYGPDIGIIKMRLLIKVESLENNTVNESTEIIKSLESYNL